MRRVLIRAGEGSAGYARIATEHAAFKASLEAALAAPVDSSSRTRATAAGDGRRLRGLPAIGRGVPGEIPGTRPDR